MLDTTIIEPIINGIINNTISINQYYSGPKIQTEVTEKEFEDKKKEVQGILTEFVVNEFFPLASDTEQFIKLVYGTFDNALNLYKQKKSIDDKDIFFVYKGGNILRFVVYEIMHELGGKVSEKIEKYYKDSFKKSDADFSIYINPNLYNYDLVFRDMNLLAYLVQDKLRIEFSKNLRKYFAFYRLDRELRKNKMAEYLNKLNQTETIKNKVFGDGKFVALVLDDHSNNVDNYMDINYAVDPDFSVEFKDNNNKVMERVNLNSGNKDNSMRITYNQALEFPKGVNFIKFSLVRTKVIFNTYFAPADEKKFNYIMMLGGELIDVSISHKKDSTIKHYFEHLNQNITTYKIGNDFEFKAPSLTYLVEDLERILYFDQVFPWDDSKYMKRLRRVLFMYYCMLLINKDINNNIKILYLKYIKDNIFGKLLKGENVMDDINKFLDRVNMNKVEVFPFTILLSNLKGLLGKEYDKDKFKEYCQVIYDNIEILISFIHTMINQCKNIGLDINDITEGKALWGGEHKNYKVKYLKYKSKYMKLKYGDYL